MKQLNLIICILFAFAAVANCHISLGNIFRKEGLKLIKGLDNVGKTSVKKGVKLIKGLDVGKTSVKENGCQCLYEKYDCGCCTHLEIEKIGLKDTACVNVTYLPDQYGISLFVTWDGKTILNETVSAKNPPPLCVGIPYVKLLDVCVAFYDLDVKKKMFHGCVKLEADVAHFDIEDIDLGCFDIPFSKKESMQYLSEEQLLMHEHAIKKLIAAMKRKSVKLNRN